MSRVRSGPEHAINPNALGAAAPELFAGISFLYALAAPYAWHNFDLVYYSDIIWILEFILVHAGVAASAIRGDPDEAGATGRAIGLGIFYGAFALTFGLLSGARYAAVIVTVTLFWRFFSAMRGETSLQEVRDRGWALASLYLVLSLVIVLGGFTPHLGIDDEVVARVRALQRQHGAWSNFDPAPTMTFLVVWYFLLAWFEYRRAALRPAGKPQNALAASGIELEAQAGELTLTRSTQNWSKVLFISFGIFGVFGGGLGMVKMDITREPVALFAGGAALLVGLLFGVQGLSMSSKKRKVLTVRRDHVKYAELVGLSSSDISITLKGVKKISCVPALSEDGGEGFDLRITSESNSPLRFACGAPYLTVTVLERLLIAVYRFGDQPEVLRVAVTADAGIRSLLDDDTQHRLMGV